VSVLVIHKCSAACTTHPCLDCCCHSIPEWAAQ
jgi:hypothetical protein